QLLAYHPPFPHSASPDRQSGYRDEREKDRQLRKAAGKERLQEPYIGFHLPLWRRIACGCARKRADQSEALIEHVRGNRQRETAQRCYEAQPPPSRLDGQPKGRTENRGKRGMAAKAKKRIAGTEVQPIRRHSVLSVVLRHVDSRLEPVEANPDQ